MFHQLGHKTLYAKGEEIASHFDKFSNLLIAFKTLKKLLSQLKYSLAEKKIIHFYVTGDYSSLMMYLLKPPGTTNEQTEADAKSHPLHSDNIPLEIALNVVLFVLEQAAAAEEHRLSRDTLDRYVTDWRAAQEKLNPRVQATKLKAGIESLHEQWRLARLEWLEELGLDKASFYSPLLSLLPLRSSSPANTVAAGRCIADYLAGVVDSDEEFTKSMALIDRNLLEFWSPELRTLFCNTSGLLMKHAKRWMNTRLNVELIRRDMERRSVLLQALVTGKSEWAAKHNKQLQEMLKSNDDSEVVAPSNELMILPQLSVVRYDSEKRTKIAVYFRAGSAGNDLPRVTKFLKLKSDRDGTLWTQPPLSLEDSFLENLEGLSIQRVRVVLVGRYEYIADKPLPQPPPTAAGVDLTSIGLSGLERGNRREFNCIYSRDGSRTSPGFCPVADFRKMHGGEAYYAPLGWHRWAVDMGVSGEEFNRKYAKWPVAFHGTKQTVIGAILERGLRMSMSGCFLDQLGWDGCVYVSPSLVYCSHPRYAQPLEQGGQWVQVCTYVQYSTYSRYFFFAFMT